MKIVVVDDHPLAMKGIIWILTESIGCNEIRETGNVEDAKKVIGSENIDIAIVDLRLGEEDGLDIVAYGREVSPNTKYIILTSFMSKEDFLRAEAMGVEGYLLKEALAQDIVFVVEQISRGKKYYDPGVVSYYKQKVKNERAIDSLTEREKEVLAELGKGLTNEEIAKALYISPNTVKKHISSILLKLNLQRRTQVALYLRDLYPVRNKNEEAI